MIKIIKNIVDDKGIMNSALPVMYKGSYYPFEIEFLVDKAGELQANRIELHANRLMKADRNNDITSFFNALEAMGREVVRNGLVDKEVA